MALLRSLMQQAGAAQSGPTDETITAPRGLVPRMPDIPEDYIKSTVIRMDTAPQQSRLSGRDGDAHPGYTHVSSLIGVCTRAYALAQRFQVEAVESVTGGHRVMWKIGRAVEKHVRTQFIEGQGRQGVYGRWVCLCEGIDHLGMFPARTCQRCGQQATRYKEPVLCDDENKIIGSPDITFLVGRYYFVPVELKSMNKKDWDALTAPLPDHIMQAAMYRDLYKTKNFLVHDKVKFVYTTKDFKWGDPYKEYQIDCTQPHIESLIQDMKDAARAIRVARETRTLPQRTICQTAGNTRAKGCPVAHLCFSMDG